MSHLIGTASIPCVGLAIVFACSVGGQATLLSPGTESKLAVAGSTSSHAAHAAGGGNEVNDTDLRSIIRAAVDDAARRTGRAVSVQQVISSEAVTWL